MSQVLEHANADERLDTSATGTREWAASTCNVAKGCAHGCLYCYARANALRFNQIDHGDDWVNELVYPDRVDKAYRGGKGRVMMPSSHDITPATADAVATVACKLLAAPTPAGKPETSLLLVTKGDGPCVQRLAEALDEVAGSLEPVAGEDGEIRNPQSAIRNRVLWRLTIGCLEDRCRAFWEPHAPPIDMRLETLRWLFRDGWQTSVSAEPLLEPRRAAELVCTVGPYVTDTIWIGAARDLRARTAWCKHTTRPAYTPGGMRTLENAIANLEVWQTPSAILRVAESIRKTLLNWPAGQGDAWRAVWGKLRWKDSYATVLRQHGWRIENGRIIEAAGHAEAAENAEEAQ